jgi:hypothetical protein
MATAENLVALGMPPEQAKLIVDEVFTTSATQTITGVKTMSGANVITHAPTGLKLQDSNASHVVTIAAGDEAANRTLSIPVLGGADTIATLGTAQTVTGQKTFAAMPIIPVPTAPWASSSRPPQRPERSSSSRAPRPASSRSGPMPLRPSTLSAPMAQCRWRRV